MNATKFFSLLVLAVTAAGAVAHALILEWRAFGYPAWTLIVTIAVGGVAGLIVMGNSGGGNGRND